MSPRFNRFKNQLQLLWAIGVVYGPLVALIVIKSLTIAVSFGVLLYLLIFDFQYTLGGLAIFLMGGVLFMALAKSINRYDGNEKVVDARTVIASKFLAKNK